MNPSSQGGGRLRAYLEFLAAVILFFVARALAHGWTADDAQQLGDYAEGVLAGTRYHTMPDPWGRHAINYWREEAAMYW